MTQRRIICAMTKLRMPRERVEKMLVERIRAGNDISANVEVAETTGGYRDWLHLFATWRNGTSAELKAAYEGNDISREFESQKRRIVRRRDSRSIIGRQWLRREFGGWKAWSSG